MAGAYNQLGIRVDCPCGQNEFREFPSLGAPGYNAFAVKCRACKKYYLILLRIRLGRSISAGVVGIKRLHGADSGSLRQALEEFPELTNDDIEFLVTVAELLSVRPLQVPA